MKELFSRAHKSKRKSTSARQEITKTVEKIVSKLQTSPSTTSNSYLKEDIFDILPKTGYTYANSGSYSPRFLGRKVVTPNMSRHRLRGNRGTAARHDEYEDDVDGDLLEYDDFSDSESGLTTESVLEDGIELRSGKNLYTLKEMIHGHEAEQNQPQMVGDFNRSAKAKTEKKSRKSQQNLKQYSQTEHKRYSTRHADYDSVAVTGSVLDYSDVQARRKLEGSFSGNTSYTTDSNIQQSAVLNSSKQDKYSRQGRSNIDGKSPAYTVKTVRTTVTEEFEGRDRNGGVVEKGAVEPSEKSSASSEEYNRQSRYVNHLYGLDEDEFSDRESSGYSGTRRSYDSSSHYGDSRYSNSRYGDSDNDRQVSTTTTVVTTITETINTISRAVVSPVWNIVGRPVMNHVAFPAWTYILHPAISTVTSVLLAAWSVLTWPVSRVVSGVVTVSSWLWAAGVGGVAEKVGVTAGALWEFVEHIVSKFILIDVWVFKRSRRRGCCLCLPLLLLLPLLFALYAGSQVWDSSAWRDKVWGAQSAIAGVFIRDSSPPPVFITENKEYQTILNQEVRNMILQLQSSSSEQLTAADVEAIVYRIINKESAALRADLEGSRSQEATTQLQWKTEQEGRLGEMKNTQAGLLAVIKDLEDAIAAQKVLVASQGSELKAESGLYLANLEEKLSALQAELHDVEEDYAVLLARVNACCQNETYYAAAIKDNVNTILAQMMAGHMSGNPSQDAFTGWLHSNYVSRETLDLRLKELANDLTAQVMAMVQEAQTSRQAETEKLQQQSEATQIHATMYGMGEQEVRQMIEAALFKYSADKTGIPDFALESAGGTVISTRCSETFEKKTALIKVFGLPLWYVANSPRTVLQPDVHPGQCWAFKGDTGFIVIQTSTTITPTGFTLEHIPKSLAPSGEIDSAPRDFMVLGLQDEYDGNGQWLGNFTYSDEGTPVQYFPAVVKDDKTVFQLYELRILSNHGNKLYTCLYRFRIHGKPYVP